MAAEQAMAIDSTITAVFKPSQNDPGAGGFINTTRSGLLCTNTPNACSNRKSLGIFWNMATQNPITANDPDPRQGWSIKTPAKWQDITVRHWTTGETRVVQMRIVGIAGLFAPNTSTETITGLSDPMAAHHALWKGGGLGTAPTPCIGTYSDVLNHYEAWFVWDTPVAASCNKKSAYSFNGFRIRNLELLYEIRTPTPLNMTTGTWEGLHTYSMAPGGDFDFGNNLRPDFPSFEVEMRLTVEHHLSVTFPPGANRLALEPEGGWLAWLNRGRRPERISRDQAFRFTVSGPVKMRLECQHPLANDCAISNPAGHQVPVQTRISLPEGMREITGGAVTKKLLSTQEDVTALPAQYVADQTSHLHFEVAREHVATMLDHPDTTYSGNVTVVWDSFLAP